MKKILFALPLILGVLHAQEPQQEQSPDQFQMLYAANGAIYHKAMTRCQEEGYKYFLIMKMIYRDGRGQRGEYTGVKPDLRGVVLKDSMDDSGAKAFGKVNVSIEIMAYKENPQNPLASDVDAYFKMIQAHQQGSQ